VAPPTEKEAVTMPTQKVFKQRVRTRMSKTGESYTAARAQLLRKAASPEPAEPEQTSPPTSDDAAQRATGKSYDQWFALLDSWGGSDRRHPEIAGWLRSEHGVDGWWSQAVTVAYERARGLRAVHQMADGFSIGVTRTVAAEPERVLEAFTSSRARRAWLPGATMRQRPTTAAGTARFDWSDPPSRVVVWAVPRGPDRTTVSVSHEKLPDSESAAREKAAWRDRLGALKTTLERA
jgi:hypothetical protein